MFRRSDRGAGRGSRPQHIFCTGNFAQRHEICAKAITKYGHELGNHTWNHADLTKLSDKIVQVPYDASSVSIPRAC